ncbi:hypothetical protein PPYR_10731 [Photinus pyralis]|uniref:USP domain-containing protein n=1 Tax=Photinus pyralis TaxID=7054 RepID=A0A5N4AH31_PHOPY|nr:ubiquitin carboxyl-terminal hydrolase 35 [Photinus pyralis]KAB0796670.1 hypothetical protein PPYR_10731 [Photinus pyralis]
MAVKHKVVECVKQPQVDPCLSMLLRVLQSLHENHNLHEEDCLNVCERIVTHLGRLSIPTVPEEYVAFMAVIRRIQEILMEECRSNDMIVATLKTFYSAISSPDYTPQPTISIVLQLLNVETLPEAVKFILQSGCKEQSLEIAMKTLCNWLSKWTSTPNLGPLVFHFMEGLAAEQHIDILIEVTLTYIERLFNLLVLKDSRNSVGPVVLYMLSSMQHDPSAFHKVIPLAPTVFHCLRDEQSESSRAYLESIINIFVALMNHFPDHDVLYEKLWCAINSVSPNVNYGQQLNHNFWLTKSPLTSLTQSTLGKVGLKNLGNTCYMNSVLQALFMTRMFRNDILATTLRELMPLFGKLQVLFALLQYSRRPSLSPNDILTLARPPGFQRGHQHDSSEFLGYLLDTLHEQEKSMCAARIDDDDPAGSNSESPTIVQRSFGGRAVTISRCKTCDTQSARADSFRELQLSFPNSLGNHSVQTLLDYYLQPEKLCGDNQYHCDYCRGLTDGERVTRVEQLPARLVLTLKHFHYDPLSQRRTKLLQHVTLDSHVHIENTAYELYAAVVHVGSNLDSGHYYTYARGSEDWYKFNDCIVTPATAEELCTVRPPETPYILFYSRLDCSDPEPLPRSSLSQSLESSLKLELELEVDRRKRPIKTYDVRYRRNDEPPPPGCGGSSFIDSSSNRYVC